MILMLFSAFWILAAAASIYKQLQQVYISSCSKYNQQRQQAQAVASSSS